MGGANVSAAAGQRQSSIRAWIWASIVPLTALIYFLTSSLVVATLLPSIRAALPALQTGWWLAAVERNSGRRARALTLWLFYLADALWLSGATAFLAVLLLAFVGPELGVATDMTRFITAMLIITASIGMTCLIGLVAAFLALRHSICVWVHPKTQRWCGSDEQRLSQLIVGPNQLNHGVFILGTSLVLPSLAIGTVTLIALTATAEPISPIMTWIAIALLLFFFVLQPALAVIAYIVFSERILARTPQDCWPPT